MILDKIKNKTISESNNLLLHCKYLNKKIKAVKLPDNHILNKSIENNRRIAIHFHVFYTDLLEEIYQYVSHIQANFTLFISVVNDEDYKYVEKFFFGKKFSKCIKILKVKNIGRDVYPFYQALHACYKDYDFIAHFHTKKSLLTDFGEDWRRHLYDNILGSNCLFDNIINYCETNKKTGFLVPPIMKNKKIVEAYYSFKYNGISCKDKIEIALKKFGIPLDELYAHKHNKDFPCGNMFVARTDAIKQFFSAELNDNDFPNEEGQITDTLQHYVELMWKYMVEFNNYEYVEVLKK